VIQSVGNSGPAIKSVIELNYELRFEIDIIYALEFQKELIRY
jgi:hypothetical protein